MEQQRKSKSIVQIHSCCIVSVGKFLRITNVRLHGEGMTTLNYALLAMFYVAVVLGAAGLFKLAKVMFRLKV
jgi:hypothetical protein